MRCDGFILRIEQILLNDLVSMFIWEGLQALYFCY